MVGKIILFSLSFVFIRLCFYRVLNWYKWINIYFFIIIYNLILYVYNWFWIYLIEEKFSRYDMFILKN